MLNFLIFAIICICTYKNEKYSDKNEENALSLVIYKEYGTIQDIDEINRIVVIMIDKRDDSLFEQRKQSLCCNETINMEFLKVGDRISFRFTQYNLDENKIFVSSIDLPSDTKNLINYPSDEALITSIESDKIIVKEDSGRTEEITISEDELEDFLDIERLNVGDKIKIFHNGQLLKGKYGKIIEIILLNQ